MVKPFLSLDIELLYFLPSTLSSVLENNNAELRAMRR